MYEHRELECIRLVEGGTGRSNWVCLFHFIFSHAKLIKADV